MDETAFDSLVEEICQRGCEEVDQIILALEQELPSAEWTQLDADTRKRLAKELSDIMAVYKV